MISIRSRIPQFWRDKPRLWFAQFEAVTASQKLGDEAKFGLVVANLTKPEIEQISDLILAPPNTKRYEQIKERLVSIFEESEGKQLQTLLNDMELGDQRPSQLLRRMRDLARDKIPDTTLRMLWIGHLPVSTRAVLAISEDGKLDSLAAMADKMHEQTIEVNSVCSCQNQASSSHTTTTTDQNIISMIETLTKEVAALKMDRGNYYRQHSQRYRSRSRSQSRDRRSTLCYFHRKFGKDAYRCRSPCSYKEGAKSEN